VRLLESAAQPMPVPVTFVHYVARGKGAPPARRSLRCTPMALTGMSPPSRRICTVRSTAHSLIVSIAVTLNALWSPGISDTGGQNMVLNSTTMIPIDEFRACGSHSSAYSHTASWWPTSGCDLLVKSGRARNEMVRCDEWHKR
jgi:hypothetical protein